MKRVTQFILLCALVLACVLPAMAATYYVDGTNGKATPTAGTSWSDAYKDIQDAIDKAQSVSATAATANSVFVKAGTYDLTEPIQLKKGVFLYGGFAGTETALESRDIAKNATILNGATITTVTSASVVMCFSQNDDGTMVVSNGTKMAASDDTRIDGFTITGGKGNNDLKNKVAKYGGGMYIRGASPIIANCTFKENISGTGGAISINSGKAQPVIINCRFENNESNGTAESANAVNGGGGAISMTNSPAGFIIDSCTFKSNKAIHGGAIFVLGYSNEDNPDIPSTITNSTFILNTAVASASPIDKIKGHNGAGGALLVFGKDSTQNRKKVRTIDITNCTFINNKATNATDGSEICLNNTDAKVTLVNTILYDAYDVLSGDVTSLDVKNSAYPSNTKVVTTAGTLTLSNSNMSQTTAKANGVTHTVYKLLAAATDLIKKGQAVSDVTTDQLGMARPSSTPSIGAVEYLEVAVSMSTLPSGTVSTYYKQTLAATVTPAQDASVLSWDIESGDLPAGITLIGDVISGTPTKAGSFDITVRVTVGVYAASKDFTLVINAAAATTVSPDIGMVSITVKNAVGSNTAAFSVTSADVKLTTASNDLTAGVKVNGTAYKVASPDTTPGFSVSAGNAKLKAAWLGDETSTWTSTSDLDALTITDLTAISGQEAISETSPDYYRFQFCVSDDYYFTLELNVLLSGEPETKVTSGEVTSGSVSDPTEEIKSGDVIYYKVPANGSDNLVTKDASGVWQLPRVISFAIVQGGFSGLVSRMSAIPRTIAQIITGVFAPNADGLFTNIGAALSTPVHPGTIFIIRLAPAGWTLPFMAGFERGAMRVAKVEDGAIVGAMTVQNSEGNDSINEEIKTLNIDTSDLRDPDDSNVKVPVPEGSMQSATRL